MFNRSVITENPHTLKYEKTDSTLGSIFLGFEGEANEIALVFWVWRILSLFVFCVCLHSGFVCLGFAERAELTPKRREAIY